MVLVVSLGCGDPAGDWAVVDVPEAAGIHVEDASGVGEVVWAVGHRDPARGAVLVVEGDTWIAMDTPDLPPLARVFAASEDEVWAAAYQDLDPAPEDPYPPLWRWDGAAWTAVEPAPGIASVKDVWGTGPDDVWIAARVEELRAPRVFHWDGDGWTAHDELAALGGHDPEWERFVNLRSGCRLDTGEVWVAASVNDTLAISGHTFHFDGSSWTLQPWLEDASDYNAPDQLACAGDEMWAIGSVDGEGGAITRRDGDRWTRMNEARPDAWFGGSWAGADALWVVGESRTAEGDQPRAQIWRADGTGTTAVAEIPVDPTDRRGLALRAVWQTDTGRTLAFGDDGLVLERRGAR